MKYIASILILIVLSCKDETKTEVTNEDAIEQTVSEMWNSYTNVNHEFIKEDMPESWFFHNNKADANRLGELVANKKKQAGSSLYAWYKDAGADLPKIGTKHIITNFEGKALAIIETTKVDTIPFNEISADYAELDMGTNIEPLKKWRKAHWDFFKSTFEESAQQPAEDMLVVCEQFETIWTDKD